MNSLKLYQITDQYLKAIHSLLDPNETEEDRIKLINAIDDSFDNKVINTAKVIKTLDAEYQAAKNAADEMAKHAKSLAADRDGLIKYLKWNIETSGLLDPISCAEFKIKLQQNPASLDIYDAELIPDLYKTQEIVIKIDNAKLKQDIKDGFEVDGARLVSEKRLVIK